MLLVLILLVLSNTAIKSKGFSLVELVIAVAVFMIYTGGLAVAAVGSHLTGLENAELAKAGLFFEEGWEAVRSIRNNDWSDITNGNHGLSSSGGSWNFSGASDNFDGITRTVTISDVYRNDSGDVVSSGGEIDPDTKLLEIEVNWSPVPTKNLSMHAESYLTNYKDPGIWPPEPPPES
jgi:hypothetical protein